MNRRQLKKWIKKEIQAIVTLVGEKIEVVGNKNHDSMMYYQKIDNVPQIGFNPTFYKKYYHKEMNRLGITLKEDIIISTLHEIGHHRDKNLEQKNTERKKMHDIWRNIDIPTGLKQNPIWKAEKDINAMPYVVRQQQLTYEIECWAWQLAASMNQQYKLVPQDLFVINQKHCLNLYGKLLFDAVDAYNALKNEHVKTA